MKFPWTSFSQKIFWKFFLAAEKTFFPKPKNIQKLFLRRSEKKKKMKKTKLDEKQLPKKIGPTETRTKALPWLLTELTFDRIDFWSNQLFTKLTFAWWQLLLTSSWSKLWPSLDLEGCTVESRVPLWGLVIQTVLGGYSAWCKCSVWVVGIPYGIPRSPEVWIPV